MEMTREEILQYLQDKRELTAPVAVTLKNLQEKQAKLTKAKQFLGKTIIGMFILTLLILITDSGRGLERFVFLMIGIVLFGGRRLFLIQPAEAELEQAQKLHNTEISQPGYINGKKNFPEKFYNYSDTYRLYKLVEEGRALTLQEAYNLLETQQFQENQLSIQEETRALQHDIASSARVAAVGSVISAFNTRK